MSDLDERQRLVERYRCVLDELKAYPGTRLIAVSKRQPNRRIAALVEAGHRDFGENYFQEWRDKKNDFQDECRWHFIGRVQSRKVGELMREGIHAIHGFGSESSLQQRQKFESSGKVESFVQVNLEKDESKGGLVPGQLAEFFEKGLLEGISGLMTIPPLELDEKGLVRHFTTMRHLADDFGFRELSMGMSHDYRLALECGATMIRVGRLIFGDRIG